MRNLYIFILFFLAAHILPAQQSDLSNMYPLNYYLVNGAAAGKDSTWQLSTGYRKQWNSIANAPSTGYLAVSGFAGQNHGVGLLMEQSKYGLLSDLHAKLSYAYHFRLSAGNTLHAGISMGIMNRKFQTSKVIASDYSDDLLRQNGLSGTDILSDVGIMFTSQRLLLGASLPQVVSSNNPISESNTGFLSSYTLHGSYDIVSNYNWLVQGIAAYRKIESLKSQTDVGARMLWKNKFGGGVGYRTLSGLFVRAEVNVQSFLNVAYSFEQGTSSKGRSHEFMVSIRFGKQKKKNIPESSREISEPAAEESADENAVAAAEPVAADTAIAKSGVQERPVAGNEEVVAESKPLNRDSLNRIAVQRESHYLDSINEIFARERLIFFKLRSSDEILSDNYASSIALVAQILQEHPRLRVSIVGHTCKLGRAEVNQRISDDRALEVYRELKKAGISPERMEYTGEGESKPIDPGDSPEELARNRRVQIVFSPIGIGH